jgi:uncharacterized membrane protein YfhO
MKTFEPPVFFAAATDASKIILQIHEPGKMAAVVFTDLEDALIFSEIAYPGWRASIDGKACPMRLFEDAFLAVKVPPGHHRVEFSYRPMAFRIGAAISSGMLLVFLI